MTRRKKEANGDKKKSAEGFGVLVDVQIQHSTENRWVFMCLQKTETTTTTNNNNN